MTLQRGRFPVIWACAESSSILPSAASSSAAQRRCSASPRCQSSIASSTADVAALELADDLLELAAQVLERPLGRLTVAHARTSSTVAARPPVASSISRRLPGATVAASFSAEPPERTTA